MKVYRTTQKNVPWLNCPIQDSPVEATRKSLPRGDGSWPGYDYVYDQLQLAIASMTSGCKQHYHMSDIHVMTMAVLGCGHEETMKSQMWKLRDLGFINGDAP